MKIVTISGSLRAASSNAALLRAAARVAPDGVEMIAYEGMATLPHFNPDLDAEGTEPPPSVRELRELLIGADAILISSPEYAHGVPGTFKNLLDWLVSTGELVGKPVALWNASPAGGEYAQNAILETLRTMNWRVVVEASRLKPFVRRKIVGEVTDEETLAVLREVVGALVKLSFRHVATREAGHVMSEDRAAGRGKFGEKYPVDTRVRGKVVAVVENGYLVAIEDDVEGLIAFSDPALSKVVNPAAILEVGDEVEAIVSELDMDQRRLSLSLRQVNP